MIGYAILAIVSVIGFIFSYKYGEKAGLLAPEKTIRKLGAAHDLETTRMSDKITMLVKENDKYRADAEKHKAQLIDMGKARQASEDAADDYVRKLNSDHDKEISVWKQTERELRTSLADAKMQMQNALAESAIASAAQGIAARAEMENQKLSEIADVRMELNAAIETQRKRAEKAEARLAAEASAVELREETINALRQRLEDAKSEYELIEAKNASLVEKMDKAVDDLRNAKAELADAENRIKEAHSEANQKIHKKEASFAETEERMRTLQKQVISDQAHITSLSHQKGTFEKSEASLKEERDQLQQEVSRLSSLVKKLGTDEAALQRAGSAENALIKLRATYTEALNQLEKEKLATGRANSEVVRMSKQLKNAQDTAKTAGKAASMKVGRANEKLTAEVEKLEAKVKELHDKWQKEIDLRIVAQDAHEDISKILNSTMQRRHKKSDARLAKAVEEAGLDGEVTRFTKSFTRKAR